MTMLMIYAAVVLLAAGVLANRAVARRLVSTRDGMAADENALREADRSIYTTERALTAAERRLEEEDTRIEQLRTAIEAAEREVANARRAPIERYYVFDRLEPRPGMIWSASVAFIADPNAGPNRLAMMWGSERTYLITAASQREAMDRATQRFQRASGYVVERLAPCALFAQPRRGARGGDNAGSVLIGSERKLA